jgi:2-keto-4-pentenoate hydratase/2-oxohepta-3-ene-1,7-dioic acid hydratase in catechol pathway
VRIARYGVLQAGSDGSSQTLTGVTYGIVEGDGPGAIVTAISGHPFAAPARTDDRRALEDVHLLTPFLPSKVVAIGKNYAAHAREMGGEPPDRPVVFLKPSTAVIGPNDPIQLPRDSDRVDYEGELAVVIGKVCRDLRREQVPDAVLGYTCANDVTARDQQQSDGQWTRGKGHDTFCPIGPWVETELDPSDLQLQTRLDGVVKQDSRTSLLLRDVADLVSYVSAFMTLLPGDVLLTGTPEGVGPMQAGSTVEVTIEGIGTLSNPVVSRSSAVAP